MSLPPAFDDLRAGVHLALKQWHKANDDASPLAGLCLFQQARHAQPGTARRITNQLLLDGIKVMERDYDPQAAAILRQRFIEEASIQQVAHHLNLAEPTIQRKQRQAIEDLTGIIHTQEQRARAEALHALEKRLDLPADLPLFGIEMPLNQVVAALASAEPAWLVAIEGIGGIGKTALAAAAVRRLALTRRFARTLWVSAQQQEFWPGLGLRSTDRPLLDRESLVDALLEQFGDELATGFSPEQKLAALAGVLKKQPCLIVLDSLETLTEYQAVLPLLQRLANPSKFLLTTRALRPRVEVARVPLTELSQANTVTLLRHEARLRRMSSLTEASPAQLDRIYEVVGGNPLALKLVAGQLHSLPLAVVLDNLQQAQGKKIEELYTYIYRQAWRCLDETSRRLLLVMPLAQHGVAAQLAAASGLAGNDLTDAIEHLSAVSLLEVSGDLEQRRYRIHRLTETFRSYAVGRNDSRMMG